ncbi:hypothetical protein ACWATR_05025 [Nostoc sp. UIC 10890]
MHYTNSRDIQKVDEHLILILYVVAGMKSGGIKTWLVYILRHIDCDRFLIDFLVNTALQARLYQE